MHRYARGVDKLCTRCSRTLENTFAVGNGTHTQRSFARCRIDSLRRRRQVRRLRCGVRSPQTFSLTSLAQMLQATNCENLSPGTVNAIVKQLRELQEKPAEGISVSHHSTGRTRHRC